MDSELKKRIINGIIKVEGGYSNDLVDSGGETNYGITVAVARAYGYRGAMKDLPVEIAFEIYSREYWDVLRLSEIEKLSPKIAEEMADTGVNMGVARAAEFLQRSLNVLNDGQKYYPDIRVDAKVGPLTVATLKKYLDKRGTHGEIVMHRMLNSLQGAYYVTLAERRQKDERFVFGWFLNRVV